MAVEAAEDTRTREAVRVHVLIPAAGRGARFGTADNKIFAPLAGKPVIARTVSRFLSAESYGGGIALNSVTVTVIGRPDELGRLSAVCGELGDAAALRFRPGGATRQESVLLGLESLPEPRPDDIVLVHDGARPLVPSSLIRSCIEAVQRHGSAVAATPIFETLKRMTADETISETVDRSNLCAAQTPQGARYAPLREALALAERDGFAGTDEASLLERVGLSPIIVRGARENIKITTSEDLEFAEHWLRAQRMEDMEHRQDLRVGTGYDIHRLVPGRRLVLGGVEIACDVGLLGHSDADVLLHAICDALLGAAGLPDIGHLFPNSDPKFSGASSVDLLQEVVRQVWNAGYRIGNVDACLIAERPKIAPHAPRMRGIIAGVLRVEEDAVSIKATTNEGLGALGAGEGIACHASATIRRIADAS